MTTTLGNLIVKTLRATKQNPNKTALSEFDNTQWLADRLNEAFQFIYELKPFEVEVNGTITIPPSTRLLNGPAGIDLHRIYDWSWRLDDPDRDIKIYQVTREYVVNAHPDFEHLEAELPQEVYLEGGQIGIRPLLKAGSENKTLQFTYPGMYTDAIWSSTFPFADNSNELKYALKYAQARYEFKKGDGNAELTWDEANTLKGLLKVDYARTKRQGKKGYRRFR